MAFLLGFLSCAALEVAFHFTVRRLARYPRWRQRLVRARLYDVKVLDRTEAIRLWLE